MIAITASNGKLGQAIISELAKIIKPEEIRITARNIEKIKHYQKEGYEVSRADYDDPASLLESFQGVDTLILISGAGPNEVRIANHRNVVDAAKEAGVRRIIYTSVVNPTPSSKFIWAVPHVDTEAYLAKSGLQYFIMRDNLYPSNLDDMLKNAVETDVFAMPGAKGKVAYVTHEDIAASIAGVVKSEIDENCIYELTGSEAFNAYDIAEVLSDKLGRKVSAVDVIVDDFKAYLESLKLPEFVVEGLTSIYVASGEGEYSAVTGDVEMLAGRKASSMRDYLEDFLK